jgi:glucose-6-phosphate 1-dehydrogenase
MGDVDQGMAAADAFVFFGATGDLASRYANGVVPQEA